MRIRDSFNTAINRPVVNGQGPLNTYEFRVKSLCDNGEESAYSVIQEFTIPNNLTTASSRNEETSNITEITIPNQTFRILPNPVRNWLQLEVPINTIGSIQIYTVDGKELIRKKIDSNNSFDRMNVHHLRAGIYFLEIRSKAGKVFRQKFIKM